MSCDDPSSAHVILAAATQEAIQLSDEERKAILKVLTKDEQLRRDQEIKIMQLKAELQNLRRKGALKASADWDSTGPDPDRSCGRCRVELGRVINRGAYCRACRLKVCKGCREYSMRTTEWVCTVCHKHMEIQAASGEWMNEFVRRPSRRRDNRVYVPAADIIKRTIRRSWTISNPTPRWCALRASPELRPYNSLPRCQQDISNYPSLALHRANAKNREISSERTSSRSPQRAQSEDVYCERNVEKNMPNEEARKDDVQGEPKKEDGNTKITDNDEVSLRPSQRVNPLMKFALLNKENSPRKTSPKRKLPQKQENLEESPIHKSETAKTEKLTDIQPEKRVSFDCTETAKEKISANVSRTHSLPEKSRKCSRQPAQRATDQETRTHDENSASTNTESNTVKDPVELCDIEPLSGTVFRKVTVRRRKQDHMRKMQAIDAGWRNSAESDLFDILLPDGEDYKLVFLSSDSSSKEEDVDDNDSSSASSFPIDECDWDYFEPGANRPVLGWNSPFGSPSVYRRSVIESPIGSPTIQRRSTTLRDYSDEDNSSSRLDTTSPASDTLFSPPPSEVAAPDTPKTPSASVATCKTPSELSETAPPGVFKPPSNTTTEVVPCHLHQKACESCGVTKTQFVPIPVPVPIPFPVFPNMWGFQDPPSALFLYNLDGGGGGYNHRKLIQSRNVESMTWQPPLVWVTTALGSGASEPQVSRPSANEEQAPEERAVESSSTVENTDVHASVTGHLESENRAPTDQESTTDSSSSDTEEALEPGAAPRCRRSYNVNGGEDVTSECDVTSDCEVSSEEEYEDDMTSSSTDGTQSDDTGTVADEKRKKFSKIFVVNKNVSSTSSSVTEGSNSSESDNDTDTERDCQVVLMNVKQIDEDKKDLEDLDNSSGNDGEVSLVKIRVLDKEELPVSDRKDSKDICDNSSISSEKKDDCDKNVSVNTDGLYNSSPALSDVSAEGDFFNGSDIERETQEVGRDFEFEEEVEDEKNKETDEKAVVGEESRSDVGLKSCIKESSEDILEQKERRDAPTQKAMEETNCKSNKEKLYQLATVTGERNVRDNEAIESQNQKAMEETIGKKCNLSAEQISKEIIQKALEESVGLKQCNMFTASTSKEKQKPMEAAIIKKGDKDARSGVSLKSLIKVSTEELSEEKEILHSEKQSSKSNVDIKLLAEVSTTDAKHSVNRQHEKAMEETILKENETDSRENVSLKSLIKVTTEDAVTEKIVLDGKNYKAMEETPWESNDNSMLNKDDSRSNVDLKTLKNVCITNVPGETTEDVSCKSNADDLIPNASCSRSSLSLKSLKNVSTTHPPGATQKPTEETQATDANTSGKPSKQHRRRFQRYAPNIELHQVGSDIEENRNNNNTPVLVSAGRCGSNNVARYTSLVMITQEPTGTTSRYPVQESRCAKGTPVSVVTSDTTTVVQERDLVIVRHTNSFSAEQREVNNVDGNDGSTKNEPQSTAPPPEGVTVITSLETLSAFEEGLADDDSWVENLSNDEDDDDFTTNSPTDSSSGEEVTLTCSAAIDHEDELRGYHRAAIDFTLHTIVEESCEESEVEHSLTSAKNVKKERPASATDLEKYFFYGLAGGDNNVKDNDTFSETSSIYSEGMESLGAPEETQSQNENNSEELASSRLEKYFLSGFLGFTTSERRDSDGSVGSDSEGKPSPEQRRKRLVRARGTGRSHSSSLDNLLANPDLSNEQSCIEPQIMMNSEDSSSSDSDTYDEVLTFEKADGQFDTVKRKKCKKIKNSAEELSSRNLEDAINEERESPDDEDGHKTPQPMDQDSSNLVMNPKNQQSRDSGFIGSCDDLLKDQQSIRDSSNALGGTELTKTELERITEEKKDDKLGNFQSIPPATSLTRKDSFNNCSSDEETNLMMCKMRQFFKTMVAANSKPTTPRLSPKQPFSRSRNMSCKPPQLVYFENELTRLMKTVPGIREDQVREIVEYLSSEDTWSDSYDSSDYTSSDLEGTCTKSALQQQISDSCKQIINKFDNTNSAEDQEGDLGDGGIIDDSQHGGFHRETAFVYQKLVASFEKMATGDNANTLPSHSSPPLIAKVMHHIGSRLVALMQEVSSGESHASGSSASESNHRMSSDSFFDTPYNMLPRSKSHDLLSSSNKNLLLQQSEIAEEREASDCERFSWRGSFDSALLATDSRNRLSLLSNENSASALAIAAAKRRSAGDLLFTHKSLSREQLDRVRSCGSIGATTSEDKLLWSSSTATKPNRRRSSVPDASSGNNEETSSADDDELSDARGATLPRFMTTQYGNTATTNSLPRLPTNVSSAAGQKAQSVYHFLPAAQQHNAKSARYRPPGFSGRLVTAKRAGSAPGLQPSHQRRGGRRSQQLAIVPSDDVSLSQAHSSPMLASRTGSKSATPSPVAHSSRIRATGSLPNPDWQHEDDLERLMGLHQNRSSLSNLGLKSDSMISVYSGAGEGRYGSVTVRGQVEFGLQYNYKAGALEIQIKQCKDLAPVDTKRNRSDPYVKVYLLPDKSKSGKRKTKVKKHTLNPIFDECLKFHISLNGLETRTLWLTVWHSDMFGRNDFLGEVTMALENKVFDDPTPKWYNLQERTEPFDDILSFKGDVIVCLKFVPPDMTLHKKGKRSRGTLHVLVKEAKALTAVKVNGTSDPFCKSYLLPDKGRSSKQKTPVVRRTVNPVWNHTFIYDDVTLQELAERCLELTVWDHDRLASNEFLGGVRFSLGTGKHYGKAVDWMDANGKELTLWKSMLERPNFWVEGCLSLRPTLDARSS